MDNDAVADEASLQVRILFHAEFSEAACSGRCPGSLWAFLHSVASSWKLDTQEIEGVNSVVKRITK
eukprot:7125188-Alexandrium_andersonii.AAC.1